MTAKSEVIPGNGMFKSIENTIVRFQQFLPFAGLVAIIIFFELTSGFRLLTTGNSIVLVNEVFSVAIGATGVLFLMSQGNIDFSMGAVVGIVGALAASISGVNMFLTLPAALFFGLLIGAVNGFIHARFNIPAFISTIGMSFVLKGISTVVLDSGSIGVPFELNRYDSIFIRFTLLFAVLIIGFILFEYTRLGKHSRAIGSQMEAANQSGVDIFKVKIISFMLSGLACGIVGFFSIIRSSTASATTGTGFEVDVLLALMLGGLPITGGWNSRFRNVVVGSFIMAVVTNGLTLWGIDSFTQQLIKGIIFIAAVALSFDRKSITVIK